MGWYEQATAWGEKYMKLLGTTGSMPTFKIADNLGSKWLGICHWAMKTPHVSTITFQKSIVDDARTFERVAAHEMVHHHNFMNLTKNDIQLMLMRVKTDGHGPAFEEQAAKINAAMGKDFVTKTSDAEYVLSQSVKKYFLYMEPTRTGIVYGWAVKLSSEAQRTLARRIPFHKGKLVETTDRRWTNCGGKIGGKLTMCRATGENLAVISKLYDEAKPSPFMMVLAPQGFSVRDLIQETGRSLTDTEKAILRRHGHEIPPEEKEDEENQPPKLTEAERKFNRGEEVTAEERRRLRDLGYHVPEPQPKLHKFEAGAKQGRLF